MHKNILKESTGHYFPSYSDDATADTLSEINKKTSKIVNDELRKKIKERDIINLQTDDEYEKAVKGMYILRKKLGGNNSRMDIYGLDDAKKITKLSDLFFNRWYLANLVTTSLQNGYYMDKDLIDYAYNNYTFLKDFMDKYKNKTKEYLFDTKNRGGYSYEEFYDTISLIVEKLGSIKTIKNNYYYEPSFLDDNDEDRKEIMIKYGKKI